MVGVRQLHNAETLMGTLTMGQQVAENQLKINGLTSLSCLSCVCLPFLHER